MSLQLFYPSSFLSLLLFLFAVLIKIQLSLSNPGSYRDCRREFRCGNIKADYPFWGSRQEDRPGFCGHPKLRLECADNQTTMMINDVKYFVWSINETTQLLNISMSDFFFGICPPNLTDLAHKTIDSELFEYLGGYKNLTLLYAVPTGELTCSPGDIKYKNGTVLPANDHPVHNVSITIPVDGTLLPAAKDNRSELELALKKGFEVKWKVNGPCEKCIASNGSCGYDHLSDQFTCYCLNFSMPSPLEVCPSSPAASAGLSSYTTRMSIAIGAAATVVGIVLILSVLLIAGQGLKFMLDKVLSFFKKKTENNQHIEAFLRNYGSLAPHRYKYSDVKKMTKSFSNKLGQGGFGDVYKGKLPDGRLVAVKVLKESKGDGEEFINEVASIGRTSHVNIVTFLGFCYERKKRALIYEFMPNGSLDKFIYHHEPFSMNRKLEWRTMYQIAVGIARGLEYLHRGCNIRIVHFDIKPHNILLDEDFCPKISDFGLAKQSKKKESIISMLDARGTVGYIAPEVFCRNFGGVSHKSDVYSYGMMILEIVKGRMKIDVSKSHTSEIYFPDPIYMYLESGNDFELDGVVTKEEEDIAKKMIVVSLWCIQTLPSDRPPMTKVVEMLEGTLENLQIPPKPFLSSPTRSPKHSTRASLATQLASEEESYIC